VTDDVKTVLGPYSASVRAAFKDPRHAGEPPAGTGQRFESCASESEQGARISLFAVIDNDTLIALRYRVYGCPHLIAAAQVSCERFEGSPVQELTDFSVSGLMETLGVPIEKTGRILLLDDALQSLRSQIDGIAKDEN